ncbi:MAG: hypothetical protein ACXQTW_02785 [Candidatus Methanospirareceae archaeon]
MERKKDALLPACRVFFDEFLKSDFIVEEDGMTVLVTPTCARCNRLFGVGEVKEVERRGKIARIKLTDLTASLTIYTRNHVGGINANGEEKKRFLAFLGGVHVRAREGVRRSFLLAEEVGRVDERVRNGWILTTAWRTMERIELLRSAIYSKNQEYVFPDRSTLKEAVEHYALDDDKLDAFASMAINAVKSLYRHYRTTTKERIVELLRRAEERGMEREKLVSALKRRGLKEEWVEGVIDELIMEGQCYESDSGVLSR